MPNFTIPYRPDGNPVSIAVPYAGGPDLDLLEAIIAAAALVAEADGRIEPVERDRLVAFLTGAARHPGFGRTVILDAFERRVSGLAERGGPKAAVDDVRRFAGHASSHLIADAGEHVAAADLRLHDGEIQVLQLIATVLGLPRAASFRIARQGGDA